MALMTIKEAAAALRVSKQWLNYWLVQNPTDSDGVLLYVPTGRRKKFEAKDIDRIIAHMRELETLDLGESVQSKIRMMDLMRKIGGRDYDQLVSMRRARGAKVREDLSVESVVARPRLKRPQRRVRLPRRPSAS